MDLKERLDRFTENAQVRYMIAGLLIVSGLVLIAGGQLGPQPQESQDSPVNESSPSDNITSVTALEVNLTLNYSDSVESEVFAVDNGTTVFQALNTTQNVSYQTSEYGYLITSINNISGTSDQYWTYTVNNESAEVGAGQYSLTESSNVTFTLS
jgi:hypothetical protein